MKASKLWLTLAAGKGQKGKWSQSIEKVAHSYVTTT